MKKTTEQLLKADLTRLYNHIQKWYEEHPVETEVPDGNLTCYGSATFGIIHDQSSDKELSVANLTLCGKSEYIYIRAPIDHECIKHKHHREKSSKSEEKIVP